jgi:hypothetical protein
MIDIILFCFFLGSVYGGFWLGAKYQTLGKLFERIKQSWA